MRRVLEVYSAVAALAIVAGGRIADAEGSMKTPAAGALLVLCLALSACAGTSGPYGLTRAASMDEQIDYGKVMAVNEWAAKRQAKVLWLNYPKKSAQLREDKG